jgi:hypothetical protein
LFIAHALLEQLNAATISRDKTNKTFLMRYLTLSFPERPVPRSAPLCWRRWRRKIETFGHLLHGDLRDVLIRAIAKHFR